MQLLKPIYNWPVRNSSKIQYIKQMPVSINKTKPTSSSQSQSQSQIYWPAILLRERTMGVNLGIGVVGVLFLAHAAYSTIQYRSLINLTEELASGPPFMAVVELISGIVFCTWAALTVPGKFLSIRPEADENRVVSLPANLDFMIFNHRGKAFPLDTDVKLK